MTTHPYPRKVRQAVAETVARQILVMKDWRDLNSQTQYAFLTDADEILTALWDASRVTDVDQLPDDAVYMNDLGGIGFVGAARDTCEVDRMEHILHWGEEK